MPEVVRAAEGRRRRRGAGFTELILFIFRPSKPPALVARPAAAVRFATCRERQDRQAPPAAARPIFCTSSSERWPRTPAGPPLRRRWGCSRFRKLFSCNVSDLCIHAYTYFLLFLGGEIKVRFKPDRRQSGFARASTGGGRVGGAGALSYLQKRSLVSIKNSHVIRQPLPVH
ncbi:hypothetical protein EVAR_86993_1 [Eumeta japonica]|uniref:Uncharacterized protein n=1 Tax=Eumeta variegata TaxID=151549 RepID=A0A4C1W791_EUMVA|nr:hypothetical protein EVAR_86993_1 [Eumeta japonica]